MNVVNTQIAYILHKRPYRETSSILEVLTRNYGRISLMARGVRGSRSKNAGNLLPFTPLLVSWQGRGSLPYLNSVERATLLAPVLKHRSLLSAMYINELLMYLLHKDDVQEDVFEQYHQCLYSLEDENNLEISLRKFEIKLLEVLGFGLNITTEADTGEPVCAGQMYHYFVEHGPVKRKTGHSDHVPQISGECLLAVADSRFPAIAGNQQHLLELKHLMRFLINFHLGNRKLKSRELFMPLIRQVDAI